MNMKNNFTKGLKLSVSMILIMICCFSSVLADVTLPGVISDNMVLQRDMEVKIWGRADQNESVIVRINNQEKKIVAGSEGTWQVKLDAMAYGGPFEMTIEGKNTIVLKNILIGDVWICSGQSNMEWRVQNSNYAQEEIAAANFPEIRLFDVKHRMAAEPKDNLADEKWQICSPKTISAFSAVGYFFGQELYKNLNIPIGLISTNWGGTVSETWTSAGTISEFSEFDEKMKKLKSINIDKMPEQAQIGPNSFPTLLYNGMVYPLLSYAIKGAIWYQGESNAGRAFQYRKLFPAMITDWRKSWGQGDFPFFFVQLANFRQPVAKPEESTWAELREAQNMALQLPNTGVAVIIDIGEAEDIHPTNKQDVGYRLALAARKIAYGQDLVYSGPIYKSMQIEEDKIRIKFSNTGSGLIVKDPYGYLKGFSISGNDHKFVWAKAFQDGNDIIVYSDKMTKPVAVRYGWADNPHDVNLYNREGLPASPFRTDDWPGITE